MEALVWVLFIAALVCFLEAMRLLEQPGGDSAPAQTKASPEALAFARAAAAPRMNASEVVRVVKCPSCGAGVAGPGSRCEHCGSFLYSTAGGEVSDLRPLNLDWVRVGTVVHVLHPTRGEMSHRVVGLIVYEELWQETAGARWTPTGNRFAGLQLEEGGFLLNWQARYYLLDVRRPVSDSVIGLYFAPYARQYGKSDQTATVILDYPPGGWKIDDIGKFRVVSVLGEGHAFKQGAVGRFLHASRPDGQALVLEDHEMGGAGQDTVWLGYQLSQQAICPGD